MPSFVRGGKVHKEKIRLEAEFLDYIERTAAGFEASMNYQVEAGDVVLTSPPMADLRLAPNAAPNAPSTYSISFYGCSGGTITRFPTRWKDMNAGVTFFKNAAQNATGAGDGGVSIIQSALNAWNNDCGSLVNAPYGGTHANLKDGNDGVNVVVFNDPGNHVAGNWTGAGTIAICFSAGGNTHTFDSTTFVDLTDADVVFQNGYAATEPSMNTAMTHELGHGIGFRHADRHFSEACSANPDCSNFTCPGETACQPATEECSTNAIMTAVAISSLGFNLQTWDQNAANALYPTSCVTITPPTGVVATARTPPTSVDVSWNAVTGATSYNVYRSTAIGTVPGTLVGNVTAPTVTLNDGTVAANTAYLYTVRAVSGTESGNSNRDLTHTYSLTDPTIVQFTTLIKTAHITELRTVVNALQTLVGIANTAYTNPTLGSTITIQRAHVQELRDRLTAVRNALSLTSSFAEAITIGSTTVKKSHIDELRNQVK